MVGVETAEHERKNAFPRDASGLPSPETLDALQDHTLLRTDQNGWTEISTDGRQMWVEVEKK
jgi:beta-lactamase superfamily II metal-dependent hydrolase